ncbi:UvrD-helicase domain-containing protein [Metaclostridioides mangenotii]|uniref:UvrD-helicase domain-containing protein n=1 Tax=Metaclostridioides mangenotii TaxID=1540 RepID=UPI00048294B4|nr:UvrD-helicase domain-containing protein [Clostridioides mangenotii]
MIQYVDIKSQLDALKIKEIERTTFYEKLDKNTKIIPKVTPFKGINTDLLYIKDNKPLFIKFVDTTEDLFSILEEELIEVMDEEFGLLKNKMNLNFRNISYNYIFIMPYVEIDDNFGFDEFIKNHVIDKNKLSDIVGGKISLDEYLQDENDEVSLNLYLLDVCSEYYLINDSLHLNENFKKISFYNDDYEYTATMMEESQIKEAISINYGNSLIEGASGTGKTSMMLSRAIKLSKVYPHHNFLIFTHNKQSCNELRELLEILYKDNNNLEVHTFGSFIFKLAKKYSLILDYTMLKNDYEKTFKNLVKQAENIIKNKNMFKGIFIDEAECFADDDIKFIQEFLYKAKYIFNIYSCGSLNISNNLNIFKTPYEYIEFDENLFLNSNYRQTKELAGFVNKFAENSNKFIRNLKSNVDYDIFYKMDAIRSLDSAVDIIKVSDLDDQISSVIWEIEYLTSKLGIKHEEIAVIYPYNKKKLKNGNTIYFQYMLKKAFESSNIPYIYADENLTNLSKKMGVTLSNIYTIKSLEYKAVIVCELEMLYNQTIADTDQDYQVNDFVGDLNKIYLSLSRASNCLKIVTTFDEDGSDLVKLIVDSK